MNILSKIDLLLNETWKSSGSGLFKMTSRRCLTRDTNVLGLSKDKDPTTLPVSYFVELAKKKGGYGVIIEALSILSQENKRRNQVLSLWAANMKSRVARIAKNEQSKKS